jgi:hypothetical protein
MPWRWSAPFLADSLDGTRVTAIHGARLSTTHVMQTGKRFPVGCAFGKGVPPRGVWHIHTPTDAGFRQVVLPRQLVFVQLVVDATGRNPEQLGRVQLIPMRPVQCSLEQYPFAVLQRLREVPAIEVQQAYD